jgi:AcrR family transcriptional regulator
MKKAALERKEKIQTEYKKIMLKAAERVITLRGFAAATMDEVAKEAQFSKATLYKYFKNKGQLILEILLQYIEELQCQVSTIQSQDLSPKDKLKEMICSILEIQSRKENIARMFSQDRALLSFFHRLFVAETNGEKHSYDKIIKLLRSKRREIFNVSCGVVKEGIDRGEFIEAPPELIIKYINALVEGLVNFRFRETPRLSPREETEQMFKFLLTGLSRKEALQKGEKK